MDYAFFGLFFGIITAVGIYHGSFAMVEHYVLNRRFALARDALSNPDRSKMRMLADAILEPSDPFKKREAWMCSEMLLRYAHKRCEQVPEN